MISRIRIDAYGSTPNEVSDILYPHADEIEKLLGIEITRGECVIERNQNEAEGGCYAFKGRLNLHPDVDPGRPRGHFEISNTVAGVSVMSGTATAASGG